MLSDRNIIEINRQIERELKTVDSWMSDADDKTAALKRIAKLKALLDPQPSREEILKELANAIVVAERSKTETTTSTPPAPDLISDLVTLFRR